ncbi:hypothetical protein EV667_0485 [Ancylobacter aquaticus]|uniref:Permease n=1 Tax=Ancylobacter aquaticus TaxID=100 RepID=A0A4R1I507_ANCAQ|nr:hypothetical protein [Ancylobacter aquaticus]TCK30397.1 hypothetical protein EV667_0485 [Ancylobacter aquaticus]
MLVDYLMGAAACAAVGVTAIRDRARLRHALQIAVSTLGRTIPALFLAVLAAQLLTPLIPNKVIGGWIGPESGMGGVLIASAFGAIIPGGPVVSFPIVLIFQAGGAGSPQLIALLSAWSVVAIHRLAAFEVPLMGVHFALRRLAASLVLPPLSGLIALLLS